MRIAYWLEKVAHILLRYWYLDFAFAVVGSFLLFLSLKLREKDDTRVSCGDSVLCSGIGGNANKGFEEPRGSKADLGDSPLPTERNGEAKGGSVVTETGNQGDET